MKNKSLYATLFLTIFGLSSWLFLQITAESAPQTTINVTTTNPAPNPGDGQCSLIEAIDNANADSDSSGGDCPAGSGPDMIVLGTAVTYTLSISNNNTQGDNGLPIITSSIVISGQGSTIERDSTGAPSFRVLYIDNGGDLTLNDTVIRNGQSTNSFNGGGIRNQSGVLTLNNSTVRDNEALNASGGGIYSRSDGADVRTTINDSDIFSNTAGISGGGLYLIAGSNVTGTLNVNNSRVNFNDAGESAGGIRSTRLSSSINYVIQVNVQGSEVSNNTTLNSLGFVGGGGGVFNYSEVLITDSTLSGNQVETGSAYGGGLINTFSNITILSSTIMNNVAASSNGPYQAGGGGLVNSDGNMIIANSTIGGNQATGSANGGALLAVNFFGSSPADTTIINSTISGNNADATAGAVTTLDFAGGQPVVVDFVNTIVSNNVSPDGTNCDATSGTTISSSGNNLEDKDTCNFDQPTDKVNTNPLLGPLQDNGGLTWTHALMEGSPAINAANNAACAASPVGGVDQRGVVRPFGPACDIGSFELEYVEIDYLVYMPVVLRQ